MKAKAVMFLTAVFIFILAGLSWSFESGSTGADGEFNPSADTEVQVPENGVFNFTTVNVPEGVTVTFKRNSSNTPVYILATGDVVIAGTLSVNGGDGSASLPGNGGPGGFDGGYGTAYGYATRGGDGLGPGGGKGGKQSGSYGYGGGGGGFRTAGTKGQSTYGGSGGIVYGTERLIPITGGSGGGGGAGGRYSNTPGNGGGGGGGGGALVIASSTTISITGSVTADGGSGGKGTNYYSAGGGGGSGGAIRLVAGSITGNGTITAIGGSRGTSSSGGFQGGNGGSGWIRIEADSMERTAGTTPGYSFGRPSSIFVADVPSLKITSVEGIDVPADARGSFGTPDITLPLGTQNPVAVTVRASNVPLDTTITLTATPEYGSSVTATGTLSGTFESSTSSISIDLSTEYQSILTATATFTVQTAMYYDGEKIEKVRVAGDMSGTGNGVTYITETGREIPEENFMARVYGWRPR